jgi:hypothetical protein
MSKLQVSPPADSPLARCGQSAAENAYRQQGDPPGQRTKITFREWNLLFRFRTTWGMVFGYFGCIYLTWIYTAWLPGYLEIERHISVVPALVVGALIGVVSAGSYLFIVDRPLTAADMEDIKLGPEQRVRIRRN